MYEQHFRMNWTTVQSNGYKSLELYHSKSKSHALNMINIIVLRYQVPKLVGSEVKYLVKLNIMDQEKIVLSYHPVLCCSISYKIIKLISKPHNYLKGVCCWKMFESKTWSTLLHLFAKNEPLASGSKASRLPSFHHVPWFLHFWRVLLLVSCISRVIIMIRTVNTWESGWKRFSFTLSYVIWIPFLLKWFAYKYFYFITA